MHKQKSRGLGRGLDALLGQELKQAEPTTLPLTSLQAGPFQPRTQMNEAALQELALSIKTHGLIQPILVRPIDTEKWEIIAGERRFRSARLAGLQEVPVVIRDIPDEQALVLALIENIQRENLNPLEEAHAAQRLVQEFQYSHDQVAEAIGRSRSATTNLLRLLNLTPSVQDLLSKGHLNIGQARALLAIGEEQQYSLAKKIVEENLSVREVEKLVQATLEGKNSTPPPATEEVEKYSHKEDLIEEIRDTSKNIYLAHENDFIESRSNPNVSQKKLSQLEKNLSEQLSSSVFIRSNRKGNGNITIPFRGSEHFQKILLSLGFEKNEISKYFQEEVSD